ncbi:MAG: HPF/RaiA family ribosome-associated protein [Alphaproteobacteria bacterium]|nr:HPF/RaiA family ribosome-associated protein [Alphaproteobacteria bacterium]NNF25018.1 HPF/RaiA family ribosome-associated protein [Paracoccaceae bacterium]
MDQPAEVTFVDIAHSDAIEARIRERAAHLAHISPDIVSCQVWVRAPHKRHRTGTEYVIDLTVQMPGRTLNVDRRPGDDHAHIDIYVAIRDAFAAMERMLRKWKDINKGRPEVHEAPLQGRIEVLNAQEGFGQIATTDGRLVYFHRNSVAGDGFGDLQQGETVELSIDRKDADAGPHASFVRPIGPLKFVDTAG